MSVDTSQPIITDVNVEGVVFLTRDQIRYLKEMAKKGNISQKALSAIEEYIPGLLEENGQLSVTRPSKWKYWKWKRIRSRAMIIIKLLSA